MNTAMQLERTGCGIASVAVLAGMSYAQAKRVANRLGIFADDSKLWSETGYVRRLLKDMELGRRELKCPSPHGRPCRILLCSPSNGTKSGIVRSGIGSSSGEGLTGLSCSRATDSYSDRLRPHEAQVVHRRQDRYKWTVRYSFVANVPACRSHSIANTADRAEDKDRSLRPSLTTTVSALVKSSVRSGPVRLQTMSGSPVSRVHRSHSPFGP